MTKRSRRWSFTLNNYTEENIAQLLTNFENICVAKEVGGKGTPYLQGYVELKNGKTLTAIKKLAAEQIHWEIAKGNRKQNVDYCTKDINIIKNTWEIEKVRDPLEGKELYDWQREILDMIKNKPVERTIYWYWEPNGNVGKTALAKSICLNNPNAIYLTGKAADMKYAIASMKKKPTIVLMDFTRSIENYISYEGIEAIKNGIFFSGKYEGKMVMFPTPHIIIFANFEPNMNKISKDKWNIQNIT